MDSKIGYWKIGDRIFHNKIDAMLSALPNENITFHYYDDVWHQFDRSKLGTKTLSELYLERALQLRGEYDYLILNYSGGIDSRTVLKTFLNNNIRLDHIVVKWPVSMSGKNLYPVINDTSSFNMLAEWDLTIKPDLEWLRSNHPEIKIEIVDWLDNLDQKTFNENSFDKLHQFSYMTSFLRNPCGSQIETQLFDQGKSVASIYGIDKPILGMTPFGNVYTTFSDMAFLGQVPTISSVVEYFYWSPKMPEIVFEQCHQIVNWFRKNQQHQHLLEIGKHKSMTQEEAIDRFVVQHHVFNSIIYPEYDADRFQAKKTLRGYNGIIGNSTDHYIERLPQFIELRSAWKYNWESWMQQFDKRFIGQGDCFYGINTKGYFIGRL